MRPRKRLCVSILAFAFGALALTACVSELDDFTTKREQVTASTSSSSGSLTSASTSTCGESDCTSGSDDAGPDEDATPMPSGNVTEGSEPPTVACGPGTYVVSSQTVVECRACPSGTFSTTEGATECEAWADCQPGEYVSTAGAANRDRTCAECPQDETSVELNAQHCEPIGCAAGEARNNGEENGGNEDTECIACQAGNFCAGGDEPAVECDVNSWDHDADPASACVERLTCGAGEYVVDNGSPTGDRTCAPCEPNTYNPEANSDTCMQWSTCEAGTYLAEEGTDSKDAVCVECPAETFSDSTNAATCVEWTSCAAPDNRQVSEPSADTDRTCAACTAPYITRQDNETTCALYAYLPKQSEVVIEAEHYSASISRNDVEWLLFEDISLSGGASVQMSDDNDVNWTVDPGMTAPQLQYRVNFADPGSYYIHLRGDAGPGSVSSDSCWAGIGGTVQQYNFDSNSGVWGWRSQNFNVATSGLHVVSVYGREDGFRLDKLVINNAATPPNGLGPDESELDDAPRTQ